MVVTSQSNWVAAEDSAARLPRRSGETWALLSGQARHTEPQNRWRDVRHNATSCGHYSALHVPLPAPQAARTVSIVKENIGHFMRTTIGIAALLIFAAQFAVAGAGNDQPTNIVITNPYSNQASWAQICWNTNNQSDSLVMIGEAINFSRQVYDSTPTTNHCVVVKNLQPTVQYYYSSLAVQTRSAAISVR